MNGVPHTMKKQQNSVPTILIVEDDMMLSSALKIKLSKVGYAVLIANDGKEGLSAAKEMHPDLILLDIVMPVMDGYTMLVELRKDSWGKNASVIILTNLNEASINGDFLDESSDYLIKAEWKLDDLLSKIQKMLPIPFAH